MMMNNALDSRVLRQADCYGQRFMRAGSYRWAALPAGGGAIDEARPFLIEVTARKSSGNMTQHDIVLQRRERQFTTDAIKLSIEVGDLVVWHCGDASAPGWEIASDEAFFGSQRLVNECGYSHAFGLPGHYEWVDAHGSGLHGVVHVQEARCTDAKALERWREQVAKVEVVMIQDGKVSVPEVKVILGQRVYFAIVTGPGVSITDRRLIVSRDTCDEPKRKAA
jgi:plastocyanin